MVVEILKAFVIGICASIPLGPIAILVFQTTLSRGHKAGFFTGMGACLVDTIYSIIAIFALTYAQKVMSSHGELILIVGGIILGLLGLSMATSNPFRKIKASSSVSASAKGFFQAVAMAISNPGAIFVILALFAFFQVHINPSQNWAVAPVILAVSAGSALYWFGVTALINMFRKKFKLSAVLWINRIAGAIVVIIGVVLFSEGLYKVIFQGATLF